ncbi:hypothetical protein Bca52824_047608 [Brassica carinata]|uniref:Uncharacterized protein n=1 Tax=Brassica carinata TaxID=52824 RepID=A0A8X7RF46_BRACI|nr:hypothetical protein Bca52824_047608 [Brassica carinata]
MKPRYHFEKETKRCNKLARVTGINVIFTEEVKALDHDDPDAAVESLQDEPERTSYGDGAEHRDVILLLGVCVPAEFCRGPEIALSVEMTSPFGIHALVRHGGSRVIGSKISVPLNGLVKHDAPMDRLVSEFYNEVKLVVVLGVTRTLRSQKTFSSYEDVITVSVFDFFSLSHEDMDVITVSRSSASNARPALV